MRVTKMKNLINLFFLLSLSLFFTSCEFFTSFFTQEKEDKEIGEFEDINIFDGSLLSEENDFITGRSIVGDKDYLYAVTNGTKEFPGKIIKVTKNGINHEIKTLYDEALQKGYTDSHGYYLKSIDFYNDKLFINAVPSLLQFENGETEYYCINPDDLSIEWKWSPEENGKLDCLATGQRTESFWNDYYIVIYASKEKNNGFFIVFLNLHGKQVTKKFIEGSYPVEDNDLCIVEDKLLLHQLKEPLIIYDLTKLSNQDYCVDDCIDFSFNGEANLDSGIVSDGKNCYFCSWDIIDSKKGVADLIVYAVSLTDYQILWKYKMDDKHYDCVNSILLSNGQLFLAADYGCVYSLKTSNGKLIWKTRIADEDTPTTLLCEGCTLKNYFVIPCDSNGYLYYFDIKTGKIKGKTYIPTFCVKKACYVENDYLYITTGSYIARLRLKEN